MSDELYKPPAFQFYVDDFLGDTLHLDPEKIGVYVLLLFHEWKNGFVPADARQRAQIMRVTPARERALWNTVGAFFREQDGMLQQKRLEQVRAEARDHAERQRQRGISGARARWNDAYANADAMLEHNAGNAKAMLADSSPVSSLLSPSRNTTLRSVFLDTLSADVREAIPPAALQDVGNFLEAVAAENKSGKVKPTRSIALVRELLAVLEECADEGAFIAGLRETNSKGIGNVNYVRQCVRSAMERHGATPISKRRAPQYQTFSGKIDD